MMPHSSRIELFNDTLSRLLIAWINVQAIGTTSSHWALEISLADWQGRITAQALDSERDGSTI